MIIQEQLNERLDEMHRIISEMVNSPAEGEGQPGVTEKKGRWDPNRHAIGRKHHKNFAPVMPFPRARRA